MNRRQFLSLLSAVPLAGLVPLGVPSDYFAPENLDEEMDEKIVHYFTQSFNLYVDNPRALGVLTNVSIPDGY